jgi:hypothetical protein
MAVLRRLRSVAPRGRRVALHLADTVKSQPGSRTAQLGAASRAKSVARAEALGVLVQ